MRKFIAVEFSATFKNFDRNRIELFRPRCAIASENHDVDIIGIFDSCEEAEAAIIEECDARIETVGNDAVVYEYAIHRVNEKNFTEMTFEEEVGSLELRLAEDGVECASIYMDELQEMLAKAVMETGICKKPGSANAHTFTVVMDVLSGAVLDLALQAQATTLRIAPLDSDLVAKAQNLVTKAHSYRLAAEAFSCAVNGTADTLYQPGDVFENDFCYENYGFKSVGDSEYALLNVDGGKLS